jgi:hypothetical protein
MIFDVMHRNGESAGCSRRLIAGVVAKKKFRGKMPHWESAKNINKNK